MAQNQKWTAGDIPDLSGKTALVTGANSGIGYEASLELARNGAQVILACRSVDKGEQAAARIRAQVPNARLEVMALDLADLSAVRRFADTFTRRYASLNLLFNNAGVMAIPYKQSADGFEMQFATNHLGHFALTGLLLDTLLATPKARIITISSGLHQFGSIDFDTLNSSANYSPRSAYNRSKLANLLFVYELQRKLEAVHAGVISVAAHPGYASTNLQYVGPRESGARFADQVVGVLNRVLGQSAAMGALPMLYAAVAPDVQSGDYIGPEGFMELHGYPVKSRSNDLSHDTALAARLWRVSEELTGIHYDFRQPVMAVLATAQS